VAVPVKVSLLFCTTPRTSAVAVHPASSEAAADRTMGRRFIRSLLIHA
jgi:hypothetical protein